MLALTRFLLIWAMLWLPLFLLMPAEASTGEEAIAVSPLLGPAGRTVTVIGTGWREHGTRGIDVPIWIGFANVVARGHPDANGVFSVSFTILPSTPQGDLIILAIIGNGGSADTIYTVSDTQPMGCVDAYFIGVHGTLEDAQSPEIEETWQAFDAKPQRTKLLFSPASHIMLQTSKVGKIRPTSLSLLSKKD